MLKILSKTLVILLVAILLLNMIPNTLYAAVEVKLDKAYLEKIGQADYHLKYYREATDEYTYLICSIVGYYDKDNNFNPTYCMNRDLVGAEKEAYYVKTESLLKNDKVWRIIKNGYPYKTAKEMGLTSKYDAYAVTKYAIYCVLGEAELKLFKAEKDDDEAVAMLNALKKLVDIGLNGTEKQDENPLTISKVGSFKEDGDFYSQEYKITSTSEFTNYEVSKITGLPAGAYVANAQGEKQTKFENGSNFKIMVPKSSLLENFNIEITVSAECKAYIILEGKTTVTDTQNYVVTAGEYATATVDTKLSYEVQKGKVKIIKVDSENNKIKISGVEFDVLDENNNKLETITTDEKGEAVTSEYKLRQYSKIYLKEKSTNENYVLNDELIEVELEANKTQEIIVQNKKIKGKIQIEKTSKDYNEITGKKTGTPLKDVVFEVYDKDGNVVDTITTDKNGIATTSDLVKGTYTIKETKTNKYYFLNTKIYEATIKEDGEVVKLQITNESKKPEIDIEKTGQDRAEVGSKIEYDISIKNTGNTDLSNVVMEDIIPSEYINVTKFKTGTYNQKIKYNFYYKTNFSNDEYILMLEDISSEENYEIDFTQELADNEYITAIKMEFGDVDVGFCSNENPHIDATVKLSVKSEASFVNSATIKGECEGYKVKDSSKWKTFVYKLLPKTGF